MSDDSEGGFLNSLGDLIERGLKGLGLGREADDAPAGGLPETVVRRVSLIIHNPPVPGAGHERLDKVMGWNDTQSLVTGYIDDLRACSHGYLNYEIVETLTVDHFPRKADGFIYTADHFVKAWRARKGFHEPDLVDYDALLDEFDMIRKVNENVVDEFWLFAFPYAGYYESIMGGPGAFWCNAPPLTQTAHADRRFIIMGFNYQRGVGEMLEAFGHRAESIMKHTFRNERADDNLWERFYRHEHKNPGRAEVGWMHYAPNSVRDYDWGNKRTVPSRWRTWRNFPNLEGEAEMVDCRDWGNGDIRLHHKWWFELLPHVTGSAGGIAYNWWQYIVDPNTVR
jgi:hypothetical protein